MNTKSTNPSPRADNRSRSANAAPRTGFIPFKSGAHRITVHPQRQPASQASKRLHHAHGSRLAGRKGLGVWLHTFLLPIVRFSDRHFRTKLSGCQACRRRAQKLDQFGYWITRPIRHLAAILRSDLPQ